MTIFLKISPNLIFRLEEKVNGGTAFIYNKKQERIIIGDNKVLNVIAFLSKKFYRR